jgi:hypothetical protein
MSHIIEFEGIHCVIINFKNNIIIKGRQNNQLYKLKCEIMTIITKIA